MQDFEQKKTDPFWGLRTSKWIMLAGTICVLVGAGLSSLLEGTAIVVGLFCAGLILIGLGLYCCKKWFRCPHCGAYLADWPKIPAAVPKFCRHCGEEIHHPDE